MVEEMYRSVKDLYYNKRKIKHAIRILSTIKDYPPAAFLLGAILKGHKKRMSGRVKSLFSYALPYYLKTTTADEPERQLRVGAYYFFGDMGVEMDMQKAVSWFGSAAIAGEPKAQFYLSKCYMEGKGVDKDIGRSLYWLEKAVEQKESLALTTYGYYCVTGEFVTQNIGKGLDLLKQAMALGERRAGKIYRRALVAYNIKADT